MYIIPGQNVDLITPFPAAEAARVFGWKHCYRTLPEDDEVPEGRDQFIQAVESLLPLALTCGVVDKGQLTSAKHEAPLVGLALVTPSGARDGILHFAVGRKAFKMGLMEEALALFLPKVFESLPALTRVSALLNENNYLVKGLLRRIGFRFEGKVRDAVLRGGVPQDLVLFGLTRAEALAPSPETIELEVVALKGAEEGEAHGISQSE